MMRINLTNCFSGAIDEQGVSQKELNAVKSEIAHAHNELKKAHQEGNLGFLNLPFDAKTVKEIQLAAGKIKTKFDNLVVLGIGGSGLGVRCLTQALLKPYYNYLISSKRNGYPRIFICDNIDPDFYKGLIDQLDIKKTCFCVISKSGNTVETISQFYCVRELMIKHVGTEHYRDNVVVITDPVEGPLRKFAKENNITSFAISPNVGGRFSVLTPVGLFPAACVGIDIAGLMAGAAEVVKQCETPELEKNAVYNTAAINYLLWMKKGKNISVMMPYADSLSLFADWYAQLWGESLGKDGKGQTPMKALGVTDQHSQLQLYREGPNDKVITIVGVEKFREDLTLPNMHEKDSPFEYLSGHKMSDILHAEQVATTKALTQARRPNMTITLPEMNAHHLGSLFMFYQIITAITGSLLKINAYNQPGVELGKKLTKEILLTKPH